MQNKTEMAMTIYSPHFLQYNSGEQEKKSKEQNLLSRKKFHLVEPEEKFGSKTHGEKSSEQLGIL